MSLMRPTLAFGPELPHFGSWQWLGADLQRGLSHEFEARSFSTEIPPTDIVVIIKFLPSLETLQVLRRSSRIVFCPVDVYFNDIEIQQDAQRLKLCHAIVTHAPSLQAYFRPFAPTFDMPHHVKYVTDLSSQRSDQGPILWVGVQANLEPLVTWLKSHKLPRELVILTDESDPAGRNRIHQQIRALQPVEVHPWTPENHLRWLDRCSAAIDIKGDDFRARHKPATKACDYLASGIPIALEPESNPAQILQQLGFRAVSPTDDNWFSPEYRQECLQFGAALREVLSLRRIAIRWAWLFQKLMSVPLQRDLL